MEGIWRNLYIIVICYQAFTLLLLPAGARQTGLDKDEASVEQDPSPIRANTMEDGRVRKRRGLIMSGTLWCGPGDDAGGDMEALGTAREADSCCRQHDMCPSKVKSFRINYHYYNWRLYTITNCECDDIFKDCLLAANTTTADRVGDWFFNILDIPCFELVYEETCIDRAWWGRCREYAMDDVAYTTSAGPYDPDINHFNESNPALGNANNNEDGLETVTSNAGRLGADNVSGNELESQSDNANGLENITRDGVDLETAEGNENDLETSTSNVDAIDDEHVNRDDAGSTTQIMNSLENILNEETVTQTVNDENTDMSNVIPNDVD